MELRGATSLVAAVTILFEVVAQAAVWSSDWVEQSRGLQCRAAPFTNVVEQGTALKVTFTFRADPAHLPAGVKHINSFLHDAFLKLSLINLQTGQVLTVKPYDPAAGPLILDQGENALLLERTPIAPWQVNFPLATLWADLEPGMYDCQVEYTYPAARSSWWHGTDTQWMAFGFWHGTIAAQPFRLEVLKQRPQTQTYWLPRRLRVERGDEGKPRVVFKGKDAVKVELSVRNGFIVGAKYYRNGDLSMLTGPPEPDDVNYIDWWYDYQGGDRKLTYRIEVFETSDAPVHMWHPGPGHGGYKVLWTNTFEVNITELQIKRLQ